MGLSFGGPTSLPAKKPASNPLADYANSLGPNLSANDLAANAGLYDDNPFALRTIGQQYGDRAHANYQGSMDFMDPAAIADRRAAAMEVGNPMSDALSRLASMGEETEGLGGTMKVGGYHPATGALPYEAYSRIASAKALQALGRGK